MEALQIAEKRREAKGKGKKESYIHLNAEFQRRARGGKKAFLNVCVSQLVVSDSLWLHGLQPARLLCSWDSPGKNTGVVCHFLLQGIFLIQGLNPGLLHCRQILLCVCVCSLLTIIYPVMQNSNSNKKTTLQDLRRGWGLCPNSSLHENPVATHTKKASWGRTDSRIPTSLVRKLQLQFNKRQAQAHKASIPLRGQSSGPQWVFHMLFFTTAPTLCLVCAGAETHISSCLWSCKTEKNIKKCLFFF